jgi:uncharacterized protein YjbI with pentapeptide repeats
MLVKNLTPFFHGTKLTSRRPPQPEMTLVVRGVFRLVHDGMASVVEGLEQGFLSGDVYGDDDAERTGELLRASDFADFKLNAEVLLVGRCWPKQRPATECPVRFAVGAWKKDLIVIGDRRWARGITGSKPSEPEPFESMPIGFTRACGGPGYEPNPVGVGIDGDVLPNVELATDRVRSRGDRARPAGYGPINPSWAERAAKMGKSWGKGWAAKRAPYYAEDFDWSYFSAAPADQQLPGYLRGDEELQLVNLNREHDVLVTRLPGLRVRAFLKDEKQSFREIAMVLDTLTVDTEEVTAALVWRGVEPVADDDFADVRTLLVASEPLASEPKPATHYRAELEAYEKDPTGVHASLPAELRQAWERYEKEKRGEAVDAPVDPGLDPITSEAKRVFGPLVSDEHLGAVAAAVSKLNDPKVKEHLDLEKAVADAKAARKPSPPPAVLRKPGRMIDPGLRPKMRLVMAEAARLRQVEKETGQTIEGLDRLEAAPHDPALEQLDPDYEPPGPLSTDPPGPGADLRERDLSDQDLSGMDLRGANLERADLSRAKLRGAKLGGAKLARAILWLADLEGADLVDADLTLVNGAYMKAAGASFGGAKMDEAFLEGATLRGAKLDRATATYAVLTGADLGEASAVDACFDHADLAKARLPRAALRGSSAVLALFSECAAERADFSGAKLRQTSFAGADLRGARFVEASAPKGFFDGAKLDGAELGHAFLRSAHFTGASLVGARFYGADLAEARFYRADLAGAQLVRANLMSADLRKCHLEGTSFISSSLYDAKLVDVRGEDFDLTDAKLGRAIIQRAEPR